MKPQNKTERSRAFMRFLLLFIVTISLVVVAIFYSIEVPQAENEKLRHKLAALQKESESTANFNELLEEAMDELNKLSIPTESAVAVNQRVQLKIIAMEKLLRQIPNSENSIYHLTIRNMSELNQAKYKLSQGR
ncbi:MAG: hypothetical protein EOO10_01485 [Chitinophagaceae bacterium]|nr:MAG: hypothetical protein EOO10_01485 [Chitinophagaceae bacterium]